MVRVLYVVFTCFLMAESYKILVYDSKFGHSHSNFMGRIADILAEAGHDVTSLISVIDSNVPDATKLSKIIKVEPSKATTILQTRMTQTRADLFTVNIFDPIRSYVMGKFLGDLYATQCRALLEEPGLIDKLKAEKYDILYAEHFDMCGVGLTEVIKPHALLSLASASAFGPMLEEFGIPAELSYNPTLVMSSMNANSFWDRLVNIYGDFLNRMAFNPMRTDVHAVFKEKYGSDFPTMEQISSTSAYIFTNTEPLIDYATPTISKVIPIGGIRANEPKNLTEYWDGILTRREKTVLVSFGSVAKSTHLSMKVKMSIVETIKSLPHVTFIWKYEVDDDFTRDYASKLENLELTKWMPQVDLLAHPNLAAFITHGGMGSTQEAALRGVPGIFIPLFGDQPRNSGMMEYNGLGKVLEKTEMADAFKFTAVIREVLENESYRLNARRVSSMLHKRPFTAREQLIKYTEFAAEFGPSKALRPQSHDMNWIEYNNVDLLLFGITALFLVTVLSVRVAQNLIGRVHRVQSKSKSE